MTYPQPPYQDNINFRHIRTRRGVLTNHPEYLEKVERSLLDFLNSNTFRVTS